MIPREYAFWKLLFITIIINSGQAKNSKDYDTNDWIPLTNRCPTCYQNDQEEQVIEKKAEDRVLNLAGHERRPNHFFPEENVYRTKKSNKPVVEQYLREVSPAVKKPKRQQQYIPSEQPYEVRGIPNDIRQQLNQGEYVNHQYFRQAPPPPPQPLPSPSRDVQKVQLPQQQLQLQQLPIQQLQPQQIQQAQVLPHQLLIPQGQQYVNPNGQQFIPPQPLFDIPIPPGLAGVNLYQTNYQNPINAPQTPTKTKTYEALNPGIQAINQGLAGDAVVSSNNNYKDLKQVTLTPTSARPVSEKETVQLVYVPLESLNQQQAQLQKQQQQNILVQQTNQELQKQRKLEYLQEQQRLAEQQRQAEQQQRAALAEQQRKEQQEEDLKLQAQEAEALRQRQKEEEQVQAILQQQQLQELRRRPQYQTRIATASSETPLEHKQQQLQSIQSDFAQQALAALKLQQQLQQQQTIPEVTAAPQYLTTTVQAPTVIPAKKRKPHQPPLAVYMEANGDVSITDVLSVLKSAKSIAVQDSAGPNSPQVFVGPYNLEPPDGYTKFELPYLSNLENNRVERKVDQLPFFVAPLSYKTPPGYSKIPLPAPHVGSVVVSQKDESHEKHVREQPPFKLENILNEEPFRLPNQPPIEIQPQARPIQPFRLEDVINQPPYRLPAQPLIDPFSGALINPSTARTPATSRPDLTGQTINQYELEQINSQFVSPTPNTQTQAEEGALTDYEEVNSPQSHTRKNAQTTPPRVQFITEPVTEAQTTSKPVRSRRPTHRTRGSTTQIPTTDRSRYTVLEEFSANRRLPSTTSKLLYEEISTPSTIPQSYSSSVESQSEKPQQIYSSGTQQSGVLNQEVKGTQNLQQQPLALTNAPTGPANSPVYYQLDNSGQFVPVQNLDYNSYKLINKQLFEQEVEAFRTGTDTPAPPSQPLTESPATIKATEPPVEITSASSRGKVNARTRTRGKSHFVPDTYEEETTTVKQENAENYKLPSQLPSIHPGLHSLINELQDQNIRPLLVPASIAPTTEHQALYELQQRQKIDQKTQTTQAHQQQERILQPQILQQQPQILQQQPQILQQQPQILQQQPQVLQQQPQLLQQYQGQIYEQQPRILQQYQSQNLKPQLVPQEEPQGIQQPIYQQPQLQRQLVLVSSTEADTLPTTLPPVSHLSTTTTPVIETTTPHRQRQRGRQRARVSTTTSAPRRSGQRTRRPTSRSRTEPNRHQVDPADDYVDYTPVKTVESYTRDTSSRYDNDYVTDAPKRTSSRQRSRVRGRPHHQEIILTERAISSSSEENTLKPVNLQISAARANLPPQSYMQFEQPVQILTQNQAERELILKQQPVYSPDQDTISSADPIPLSIKNQPTEQPKLSVDVLINHPITENVVKQPVDTDPPHVRFSSNLESNTRLQNHRLEPEEITTTIRTPPTRIRTRGRARVKPKPTTPRPTTTTINHIKTTTGKVEDEEEEYYGFIRPPNYNRPPPIQVQPQEEPRLYSATYVSSTGKPLHYEDQPLENSNNVQIYSKNALPSSTPRLQFVGKIRPKYPPSTEKIDEPVEITTETITTTEKRYHRTTKPSFSTKNRVRSRLRIPTKKPKAETTVAATTPRPSAQKQNDAHRFKPRGVSHFQLPETLQKDKLEDEDVVGGNYPVSFLQAQETQTDRPKFQITIDPGLEENLSEEDQEPYSSIYRPKYVPVEDGEEVKAPSLQNYIPVDRKVVESQEQPHALPIVSTTSEAGTEVDLDNNEDLEETDEIPTTEVSQNKEVPTTADNLEEESKEADDQLVDVVKSENSSSTTTLRPKSRRRGVWRLVKRPVDSFETAESQYVGHVIAANSFDVSEKGSFQEKGVAKEIPKIYEISTSTTEPSTIDVSSELPSSTSSAAPMVSEGTTESFFHSLYKMFGISEEDRAEKLKVSKDNVDAETTPIQDHIEVTTLKQDSDVEKKPTQSLERDAHLENDDGKKNVENLQTEVPLTSVTPQASSSSQIPQNFQVDLDPWDLALVRTSTSTEISHETEICYRGKCVKSSGQKVPEFI